MYSAPVYLTKMEILQQRGAWHHHLPFIDTAHRFPSTITIEPIPLSLPSSPLRGEVKYPTVTRTISHHYILARRWRNVSLSHDSSEQTNSPVFPSFEHYAQYGRFLWKRDADPRTCFQQYRSPNVLFSFVQIHRLFVPRRRCRSDAHRHGLH